MHSSASATSASAHPQFGRATPVGDPPPLEPYAVNWLDPGATAVGRFISFLDASGDASAARDLFRTFPTLLARTVNGGHGRWLLPAIDIYDTPPRPNDVRYADPYGPDFVLCEKNSEGYWWIPITVLGARDALTAGDTLSGISRRIREAAAGLKHFESHVNSLKFNFEYGDTNVRKRMLESYRLLQLIRRIAIWTRDMFGPPNPGLPSNRAYTADAVKEWERESAGKFAPSHLFNHEPRPGFILVGRRANISDVDNLVRSKVREECRADVRSYDWLLDILVHDAATIAKTSDVTATPPFEIPVTPGIERNIVDALKLERLTGERLAKLAGYPYNSNFKATLSDLKKRKVLVNFNPGYEVHPDYRHLISD